MVLRPGRRGVFRDPKYGQCKDSINMKTLENLKLQASVLRRRQPFYKLVEEAQKDHITTALTILFTQGGHFSTGALCEQFRLTPAKLQYRIQKINKKLHRVKICYKHGLYFLSHINQSVVKYLANDYITLVSLLAKPINESHYKTAIQMSEKLKGKRIPELFDVKPLHRNLIPTKYCDSAKL
ncbi:MAG: hypothetical protein Q7R33_01680 [Nitrosarchaeum sp.]|nr:hypothetical protein [Nitrosarchaeum sp.]